MSDLKAFINVCNSLTYGTSMITFKFHQPVKNSSGIWSERVNKYAEKEFCKVLLG